VQRYVEKDPERYRKNGHQSKPRQFSCSLCDFSYRFAQLRDRRNGRSLMSLVKALSIREQVRFLDEALELGIGLCAHVSYRRAAGEVERIEVKTLFIELGSPWENGYNESFKGKFRDELLNREVLFAMFL
jgi:hypothetical protein